MCDEPINRSEAMLSLALTFLLPVFCLPILGVEVPLVTFPSCCLLVAFEFEALLWPVWFNWIRRGEEDEMISMDAGLAGNAGC